MPRDNICVYGSCLFYVCCSDCVGVCGNVCCVAAVVKDSVLALECGSMLYVSVRDVMYAVFSVGARIWEL